jgi:hypothetical protein
MEVEQKARLPYGGDKTTRGCVGGLGTLKVLCDALMGSHLPPGMLVCK